MRKTCQTFDHESVHTGSSSRDEGGRHGKVRLRPLPIDLHRLPCQQVKRDGIGATDEDRHAEPERHEGDCIDDGLESRL